MSRTNQRNTLTSPLTANSRGGGTPDIKPHSLRLDVKQVRASTGMTQEEFSERFSINLGTLRHWERGDRIPSGTALVLLQVISSDADAVLRALEALPSIRRPKAAAAVSSIERRHRQVADLRYGAAG